MDQVHEVRSNLYTSKLFSKSGSILLKAASMPALSESKVNNYFIRKFFNFIGMLEC